MISKLEASFDALIGSIDDGSILDDITPEMSALLDEAVDAKMIESKEEYIERMSQSFG